MRPQLRDGVFLARSGENTVVLGLRDPVVLPGARLTAWVRRLAGHLDGQYTVAELTAGQPPDTAAALERVVAALASRGLVVDADPAPPTWPDPAEAARFAAEVMVAGDGDRGAGVAGFRRWRQAAVLVLAEGTASADLTDAVVQAGGRPLRAVPARWTASMAKDQLAAALGHADVVVHLAGPDDSDRATLLCRLCLAGRTVLATAMVTGDLAWLGPFGPRASAVGWDSAWRRRLVREASAPSTGSGPASPTVALVLRNRLVHEAFKQVTGVHEADPGAWMIRLDLRTLTSTRHQVLAHPLATATGSPLAEDVRGTIVRLRTRRGTWDNLDERARPAVDRWFGLLHEVGDGGYAQLPLRIAVATVADPVGLSGGRGPVVVAAGPDPATARTRAIQNGLTAYAGLVLDPRRLLAPDTLTPLLGPSDDPDSTLTELRAYRLRGRLPGIRLPAGRLSTTDRRAVVAVDAAEVFPGLGPVGDRTPPPLATGGRNWADAVRDGLRAQCLRLTLAALDRDDRDCPLVAVDRVRIDPVTAHYRALLASLGITVTVRLVTGPVEVPVFGFEVDDRAVTYTCAGDPAEALRAGWEHVLLAYQARLHDEPGYAPGPVPPVPPGRRSPRLTPPPPSVSGGRMVSALRKAGMTPVVVPLDHDPEVAPLVPVVVRVLIHPRTRGET